MSIQWFPGHMLTARKDAAETMRRTDVVIEVLDARLPHASCNPMLEGLRRQLQRPALKLLNMADLADPARTSEWLAYYNAQPGVRAVALSAKNPGEVGRVPDYCLALAPHRSTKLKPLRMMILGIPNVGKSTLMNALLKRHVAKVGDEPAVTKIQMRHDLSPLVSLVDTPGMLWPAISAHNALKLAATHSIGRNAYGDEEVAADLGRYLLENYRGLVVQRFGELPEGCDGHDLIACIARRRGLVLKGGEPNLETAASTLLHDFRDGSLGRVSLETPQQVRDAPAAPPKKPAKEKAAPRKPRPKPVGDKPPHQRPSREKRRR